jgi:hypothetical protein
MLPFSTEQLCVQSFLKKTEEASAARISFSENNPFLGQLCIVWKNLCKFYVNLFLGKIYVNCI